MKKTVSALLICLVAISSYAQSSNRPPKKETKKKDPIVRPNRTPSLYITTSTGLNNNTGIVGFSFDIPIEKVLSVETGVGTSTWGTKVYLGGKYYTQPNQRGWAFGTGITFNTGIQGFQDNLQTAYGPTQLVTLNLKPQFNVLFAAYRYWNLGKRYNRFYIELGWSVPLLGGDKYEETVGDPLSPASSTALKLIAPGGVIAGLGFSFAIH